MAKLKTSLSVSVIFSLCFLAGIVLVLGSSDSDPDQNPIPSQSPSPAEYLESLGKYFKGLEERNRELEKSQQEFKDLKANYEKSHADLKEEFKTLKEEMNKLKNGIKQDHGVWLLTPRLRGPPGKQGEIGAIGPKGEKGDLGVTGSPGSRGANGAPGQQGQRGAKGDQGPLDPRSLKSCSDAMEILPSPRSTKQVIYPHGNTPKVEVLCDFQSDDGGWTVIQKRNSGSQQEFNQNWNEYSNGFGSLDKNFWIGLEKIRALTKNGDQELRIELEDFEGNRKWAKYSNFSVSDASDFYRLSIGGFSGDAGDSMNRHNGMRFSTKDKDNDIWSENCARDFAPGGWWFSNCLDSNLNGLYRVKGETFETGKGINWYHWKSYSLAKAEMKIRKKKSP